MISFDNPRSSTPHFEYAEGQHQDQSYRENREIYNNIVRTRTVEDRSLRRNIGSYTEAKHGRLLEVGCCEAEASNEGFLASTDLRARNEIRIAIKSRY
jgi:hypothetical protein